MASEFRIPLGLAAAIVLVGAVAQRCPSPSSIYALGRGLVGGGDARCTRRVGAIGAHMSLAMNKREENKIF